MSRFQDQSTCWEANSSAANKDVSRFHDESSRWDPNDSRINKDVSRFQDQSSCWDESVLKSKQTTTPAIAAGGGVDQVDASTVIRTTNLNVSAPPFEPTGIKLAKQQSTEPSPSSSVPAMVEQHLNMSLNQPQPQPQQQQQPSLFRQPLPPPPQTPPAFKQPQQQQQPPLIHGCCMMRVHSLFSFYMQLANADETLMTMNVRPDEMAKPFERPPPIGTLCISPYHVDKQSAFYRARVLETPQPPAAAPTSGTSTTAASISSSSSTTSSANANSSFNTSIVKTDAKCKIVYVDYGNEDYVNFYELYRMTSAEMRGVEPLAIHCSLRLTDELAAWLDSVSSNDAHATLLNAFKQITSKAPQLTARPHRNVKQRIGSSSSSSSSSSTTSFQPVPVDLFVGDVNVCDLLVQAALAFELDTRVLEVRVLAAHVSPDNGGVRVRLLNKLLLDKLDKMMRIEWAAAASIQQQQQQQPNQMFVSRLPTSLVDLLTPPQHQQQQQQQGAPMYGRARLVERVNSNDSTLRVRFVDFDDFEASVACADVRPMSTNAAAVLTATSSPQQVVISDRCMQLSNAHKLRTLTRAQLEHLAEIVKLLLVVGGETTAETTTTAANSGEQEDESTSSSQRRHHHHQRRLRATVVSSSSSSTGNTDENEKWRNAPVRIVDVESEELDCNCVVEMCVELMSEPFEGNVLSSNMDGHENRVNIECLHKLSSPRAQTLVELQKLFRSTGLIDTSASNEYLTPSSANTSPPTPMTGHDDAERSFSLNSTMYLIDLRPSINRSSLNDLASPTSLVYFMIQLLCFNLKLAILIILNRTRLT